MSEQHSLAGARLFIYRTKPGPIILAPLFADEAKTISISNPIVADDKGQFPHAHYDQGGMYVMKGETASCEPIHFTRG